ALRADGGGAGAQLQAAGQPGARCVGRQDPRGRGLAGASPAGADRGTPAAARAGGVAAAGRFDDGLAHPQGGGVLDNPQGRRWRALRETGGGAGFYRPATLDLPRIVGWTASPSARSTAI